MTNSPSWWASERRWTSWFRQLTDDDSEDDAGDRLNDSLHRRPFARRIAETVSQTNPRHRETVTSDESLIIGIYGGWGSGKTYLKELVLEELDDLNRAPLVVEFNPWEWAGQQKLTEGFFRTLEEGFRQEGVLPGRNKPAYQEAARSFEAMGRKFSALTPSKAEFDAGKGVALAATGYLGMSDVGLSSVTNALPTALGWIVPSLSVTKIGVGVLALLWLSLWIVSTAFQRAGQWFRAEAKARSRTLQQNKDDIRSVLMKKLDEPVLVVIDDIDRLTADQVRMMFQLVKANADFPNLSYLLLFERSVVEKSLEDAENGIDGRLFLEKIVHQGYDLPEMNRAEFLDRAHTEIMDAVRMAEPEEVTFDVDPDDLFELIQSSFDPYLDTVRNLHRLTESLPFHLQLYVDEGELEVNVRDLVVLEVLRIFEPDVYPLLSSHRTVLTGNFPDVDPDDLDEHEEVEARIEETVRDLVEDASDEEGARGLLNELFPILEWSGNKLATYVEKREDWHRARRMCHPNVFDRYVQRILGESELRTAQVSTLLREATNTEEFGRTWRTLIEDSTIQQALIDLRPRTEDLNNQERFALVTALVKFGPLLPGASEKDTSVRKLAVQLIGKLLLQIERINDRGRALIRAISAADDVSFAVYVLKHFDAANQNLRERGSKDTFLSPAQLKSAKELCAARAADRLQEVGIRTDSPQPLLFAWWHWRDPDETADPEPWILGHADSDQEFVEILRAAESFLPFFEMGFGDLLSPEIEKRFYERVYEVDDRSLAAEDAERVQRYRSAYESTQPKPGSENEDT